MRLTLRISLILLVFAVGLFGAFGWYIVRVERAEIIASAREEAGLLARSLRLAIKNALRHRQFAEVRETVAIMKGVEPGLIVGVFAPDGTPITLSDPDSTDDFGPILERLKRGQGRAIVEIEPRGVRDHIVVAQPLFGDENELLGAFVLARPIARLEQALAQTERDITLIVIAAVLAVFALTGVAGTLLIGRPLARLVEWMRRIRETGSLDERPTRPRRFEEARDEIQAVEREFGSMLETLRATEARLGEQIVLRDQLEHSMRRADKLATVGQLAAGLAHEIGSPLQILGGRARALHEESADAEVKRQAKILLDQSERISRIVAKLLSYARRQAPKLAEHDVVPLVRSVAELLEHETKRRRVHVRVSAPERALLRCDSDLLQQVTLNLLTNALRATPAGGTVAVLVREGSDDVTLTVSDSGPGVPEALRASLFEPFFTMSDDGTGTGLGLAVVKSIVTEHGGTVDIDTSEHGGAKFVVRWPKHTTLSMEESHETHEMQSPHPR